MPLKDKYEQKPSINLAKDEHKKHCDIECNADLAVYMWNNGYVEQLVRPGLKSKYLYVLSIYQCISIYISIYINIY